MKPMSPHRVITRWCFHALFWVLIMGVPVLVWWGLPLNDCSPSSGIHASERLGYLIMLNLILVPFFYIEFGWTLIDTVLALFKGNTASKKTVVLWFAGVFVYAITYKINQDCLTTMSYLSLALVVAFLFLPPLYLLWNLKQRRSSD